MYILLKNGQVIQTSRMIIPTIIPPTTIQYEDNKGGSGEVLFTDVLKMTDDRPELISYDQAMFLTNSYRIWSGLAKDGTDDDEVYEETIRTVCHDIMDYLCHTKQALTPEGFFLLGTASIPAKKDIPRRIKVVQANLFRDGGTIEYKDIHNRSYFVPAPIYDMKGIYFEWSVRARQFPNMYELKNIELEIVSSFTSAEVEGEPSLYVDKNHPDYKGDLGEALHHRDDRPGC